MDEYWDKYDDENKTNIYILIHASISNLKN